MQNNLEKRIKDTEIELRTFLIFFIILYIIFGLINIKALLYFFVLSFIFFIILGLEIYSILKLKKDEVYHILLSEYENIKKFNYNNLFFTDNCIVDLGLFFKKIYYKDIAIIDIIDDLSKYENIRYIKTPIWITVITKKFKKIKIAKTRIRFTTVKEQADILKEIKTRVPNVLIGYTKENIEKVKQKTV